VVLVDLPVAAAVLVVLPVVAAGPVARPAPADSEPVAVVRPAPAAVPVEEVALAPVAAGPVAGSAPGARVVAHPVEVLGAVSPTAGGPGRINGPAGRRSAGAVRS
jgi:hypothetical protein